MTSSRPLRMTCANAFPHNNKCVMRVSRNTKDVISGFGSS
nr:MAG TPA: hypothetical protein [Caudoviricetes sp.]